MERLLDPQPGLLPAGVLLSADRDKGRRTQHAAELRGRPGARRCDPLGARPAVRGGGGARLAWTARIGPLAYRPAGDRRRLSRGHERSAANDVVEPDHLASGRRRLQRPLHTVVARGRAATATGTRALIARQ